MIFKRSLSSIIAGMIVFSGAGYYNISNIHIAAAEENASGICGDSLMWSYDSNSKNLTISGEGEMYDFALWSSPWHSFSIETVSIEEGVTSIGSYAFQDPLSHITSNIVFPSTLQHIRKRAFYDSGIKEIKLNEGLLTIEDEAFLLSDISEVTLPDSLQELASRAFSYSDLERVNVSENNQLFRTVDGILYSKDMTSLLLYPCQKNNTSFQVPEGIECISDSAFCCAYNLTSISIPSTVKVIGECAFEECNSLSSIDLPNSIEQIGNYAFVVCSSLRSIQIPQNVKCINEGVFMQSGLREIDIPENIREIKEHAFWCCGKLDAITFQNPNCIIFDNQETINNSFGSKDDNHFEGTIFGQSNSSAQTYAEKYGYRFAQIGSESVKHPHELGNVDGDERTDAADATLILIEAACLGAGDAPSFSDLQKEVADVNHDERIDAADATVVLIYAAAIGAGYDITIEQIVSPKDTSEVPAITQNTEELEEIAEQLYVDNGLAVVSCYTYLDWEIDYSDSFAVDDWVHYCRIKGINSKQEALDYIHRTFSARYDDYNRGQTSGDPREEGACAVTNCLSDTRDVVLFKEQDGKLYVFCGDCPYSLDSATATYQRTDGDEVWFTMTVSNWASGPFTADFSMVMEDGVWKIGAATYPRY